MAVFLLGTIAFVLFFIYDLEQAGMIADSWHKIVQLFFSIGFLFLLIATGYQLWQAALPFSQWTGRQFVSLVGAVFFLSLLVYTLFFALPFEETYVAQSAGSKTYDRGMYALCRHPGVLWFAGFYVSLWFAFGGPQLFWMGLWFSFLNWCYVILQDCCTFPRIFSDYEQYKQRVPFLIPNSRSLKNCVLTLRKSW